MERALQDIGLAVKQLQMQHQRAANAALAELDITLVQWDALRQLHHNPDASLHDLARLTFQTDQSFGSLAGRLLTRGLIERVPGPGRAIRHRLTTQGEQLRHAGARIMEKTLIRSFQPLTATERDTFDQLLHKLIRLD